MNIKCINPFRTPHEIWKEREPTHEESQEMIKQGTWKPFVSIKEQIDQTISNPMDAAEFLAANQYESRLDRFVINFLDKSNEYSQWLSLMPESVPGELLDYQGLYPPSDFNIIDQIVNRNGIVLPDGQFLFHGGLWPKDKYGNPVTKFVTDRVLSTSFCPKVALNNGEWRGKAWDANRLDLIVIRTKFPETKAFIFDKELQGHGHELEVLFAKGATLTFVAEIEVCPDRAVNKYQCKSKKIKTFVINAELS
ncbi:TPA: hypothetical protein U5E31_003807 [Yersinia enterocolitica]|uniref:hypothetical protein n=1 Tax=Yersinia enterocolitica TaxID=630 RepID=UPI001C8E321C|nr:hypothetical protein [Yersinia enterocolitica]ELI7918227.1 hypothetical protein [Yersinia enterocolitica]ELI8014432.1 hypothetical protein [Yersinia enterocolitica]ELI8325888.1 hypothetical protein [Yersinia enterocolitica]MBX9477099.1 hypothetical protein [Yersinia enterocolitica]HDL8054552.1 hypothetical protein [Yersinia enterocolitica]